MNRLQRLAVRLLNIPTFDPATQKVAPAGHEIFDPSAATLMPFGQSIYDPAVFGIYSLSEQIPVRKNGATHGFDFDEALNHAQGFARTHSGSLSADRYRIVLGLIESGAGVCLDACTPHPLPFVKAAIEAKGYVYEAIDVQGGAARAEDLRKLSYADGSILRIISLDTLEHIENYPEALREMHRVLTPGGVLIIHVPCYFFDKASSEPIAPGVDPWEHVRYFSARELLREACNCGFVALRAGFHLDYGATVVILGKPTR